MNGQMAGSREARVSVCRVYIRMPRLLGNHIVTWRGLVNRKVRRYYTYILHRLE